MTTAPESQTGRLVHTLTTVGALAFAGWVAFAFRQAAFTRRVGTSQFDGVWEQRLEVLSFIVFAPNVAVLAPAAAAAAAATWLAGPTQELGLAVLLRLIRWSATALVAIAVVSIAEILFSDGDSPSRIEDVANRVAGLLLAVALIVLCRSAGRAAPGG